jgi:predicted O-methyltransferase YrrM
MVKEYPVEVPELVLAAKSLAVRLGFDLRPEGNSAGYSAAGPSACLDEVGTLLRTLTATVVDGQVGEVGTGAGV